jgi:hypothetical protein
MNDRDNNEYSHVRRELFVVQTRIIAVLVLILTIAAWWKQDFIRAIVGGVALYAFLMLLVTVSNLVEGRRKR